MLICNAEGIALGEHGGDWSDGIRMAQRPVISLHGVAGR